MKKTGILLFGFILLNISVYCQEYEYLEKVVLKVDSDYKKNEKTILDCMDYLTINAVDQGQNNRVYCNRFIYRYGTGTPYVSITIDSYVTKLFKKNESILSMYMGYWLKSAIQNKDKDNNFHEEYTVTEIYKYAKAGKGILKTKIIESLLEYGDKSQIKEWIKLQKK